MNLILGVLETPHPGSIENTGELAEILERKYALFSQFAELNFDKIADTMADSIDGAINNVLAGLPPPANPYQEGAEKVTEMMVHFIDTEGIVQSGVPGVPTQAALDGVNSRLKVRHGARRPSFIDSGILRASLKAWTETD